MSDRSKDNTIRHPADERTSDQSAQSASGLSGGQRNPKTEAGEDVLNRNEEGRYETPRQYDTDDDAS
jgi:hypothetical protein